MNFIKVAPLHSSDDLNLEHNKEQTIPSQQFENPLKKLAQITPQTSKAFFEITEQHKDFSSTDISCIPSLDDQRYHSELKASKHFLFDAGRPRGVMTTEEFLSFLNKADSSENLNFKDS